MKIDVSQNIELDIKIIRDFYIEGDPVIVKSWPNIFSVDDIPIIIKEEHGRGLKEKVALLKEKELVLLSISEAISEVIGEPWRPIEKINIYVGACPIAPRFLSSNSFLLPYYHSVDTLINWSAHEMIHFLYFKKWKKLFPNHNPKKFEHPGHVWVLSEILVAVIGSDKRIKNIVKSEFGIYEQWKEITVNEKGLIVIFTEIYQKSKSFNGFLKNSWKKYQGLDRKHNLTKRLAQF